MARRIGGQVAASTVGCVVAGRFDELREPVVAGTAVDDSALRVAVDGGQADLVVARAARHPCAAHDRVGAGTAVDDDVARLGEDYEVVGAVAAGDPDGDLRILGRLHVEGVGAAAEGDVHPLTPEQRMSSASYGVWAHPAAAPGLPACRPALDIPGPRRPWAARHRLEGRSSPKFVGSSVTPSKVSVPSWTPIVDAAAGATQVDAASRSETVRPDVDPMFICSEHAPAGAGGQGRDQIPPMQVVVGPDGRARCWWGVAVRSTSSTTTPSGAARCMTTARCSRC